MLTELTAKNEKNFLTLLLGKCLRRDREMQSN